MFLAIGHFCIKNVLTFLIWPNGSEKSLIFLLIKSKTIFSFKKIQRWVLLIKWIGRIGFFSEPFDQITKVRTFLMQKWPMPNNILYCDFLLQLLLHTLPSVIVAFLLREMDLFNDTEKGCSKSWICWSLGHFASLDKKSWLGNDGHMPFGPPM